MRPYTGTAQAPELALDDLSGRHQRLRDRRGRVVLVNFWASWCPPCVEELPSLSRLYGQLHPGGLEILAVDVGESADTVRQFLRDKPTGFPVLFDPDGTALRAWKVYAFPTSFILDASGRIRYSVFGAFDWQTPEVLDSLRRLMHAAPVRADPQAPPS